MNPAILLRFIPHRRIKPTKRPHNIRDADSGRQQREILTSSSGLRLDEVILEIIPECLPKGLRGTVIVDSGRSREGDIDRRFLNSAGSLAFSLDDAAERRQDTFPGWLIIRAHGELQVAVIRDDIRSSSGLDTSTGKNSQFTGRDFATDNTL